jgi:nitrogen fixation/metabolism regulation signal transduction histidine kinase
MNLIDNSIYWLGTLPEGQDDKKRIYVGTTRELHGEPAILVADNGPGFIDPPEYLIEPFITRKVDGMGLGLHIASEVMKAHNGSLEFPPAEDLELPEGMTGAVVALVFKRGQK